MCPIGGDRIFTDLLLIFLAIFTLIGTLIYIIISEATEKKVSSATEIQQDKALLSFFIMSGYDYWKYYDEHMDNLFSMISMKNVVLKMSLNCGTIPYRLRRKFKTVNILLSSNITVTKEKEDDEWVITDKDKKNIFIARKEDGKLTVYKKDIWNLDQAIKVTERGYDLYATKLEERKKGDSESERIICKIKNNLAYYYAEKQKLGTVTPGEKALAQELVEYTYKRKGKYPKDREEREHWVDTYNFVRHQFSLNK